VSGTVFAGVLHDRGTTTVTGGTVTGNDVGIEASNGTATISGGSVSGGIRGVQADIDSNVTITGSAVVTSSSEAVLVTGGMCTISGGTVSGGIEALFVHTGSATISGGSVTGELRMVDVGPPSSLTVIGCNLALSGGQLAGVLQDGSLISDPVSTDHPDQLVIQNLAVGSPQLTCPADKTVLATSAAGTAVSFASPTVSNVCGTITPGCDHTSGDTFPVGTTTVHCSAMDQIGQIGACQFNVTVLPAADLQASMSADQSSVKTGHDLTYTINVTNAGPDTASGVVVTDPLPAGAMFVSASGSPVTPPGPGGTVTWSVGDLPSGTSVTLTVVVKALQPPGTTLINTAAAASSVGDPHPGDNRATVKTAVGK
jgi:uncharacterized repeat protein (TIGR01451 family)